MNTPLRAAGRWLLGALVWAALGSGALAEDPPAGSPPEGQPTEARFDILEFVVEGNSVLQSIDVERAVYPFLGPSKTIRDVDKAREALEKAYQAKGYLTVFVDIPEQTVEQGLVRLHVTEGRVQRLRITGNRYYARGRIRAKVTELAPGTVPNFPRVQEQLVAVSASDRQITPVLRPGAAPGTVDVELQVKDRRPLHASVELNNRQTPDTQPLRLQATARYDDLWQRGHGISALFQTAPEQPRELRVFSGTYTAPVGKDVTIAAYGVYSASDIAAIAGGAVIGQGTIAGLRAIVPLPTRGAYFHTATVGIDYKNFDQTVRQGSDTFDSPIQYVPVSVAYRLNYFGDKTRHGGSISVNGAPRGFFGNEDASFEDRRFNARASYLYLRGDWLSEVKLPSRFAARVRVQGQLASQPLISNEQFLAGGAESVRGYLEVERLGDNGITGQLELERLLVGSTQDAWLNALTALVFADGGSLAVIDALPGQAKHYALSSAGLGLRLRAYASLQAAMDVAVPFRDGQSTRAGDPRVHFRVAYEF